MNAQAIGWCGFACVLGAYGLVSFDIVAAQSVLYLVLNALGACLLAVLALRTRTYQSVVMNAVWLCVALIGLVRVLA